MTFVGYLGYVPAGFYDALGEMFKGAVAGFFVVVFLICFVISVLLAVIFTGRWFT